MSYHKSQECFKENLSIIGEASKRPLEWNLNTGLKSLSSSLQSDLGKIQILLSQILAELQRKR